MTVTFAGESFDCTEAVRDGDRAILRLREGGCVEFIGVGSWEDFSLEDGAWSAPAVTPEEQLRADVDFIAVMMGVSL